MSKARSIGLILVLAVMLVPAAQADDPAEFQGINSLQPQTAVQRIIAQERARTGDPALFGPSSTPVQVVGSPDGFDVGDAGIGGAAALALALITAAALAVRSNSHRHGPAEATSVHN